jgi:hypothetical protein
MATRRCSDELSVVHRVSPCVRKSWRETIRTSPDRRDEPIAVEWEDKSVGIIQWRKNVVASRSERTPVIHEGLPTQLPDIDPEETQEWLDSLDALT